MISSGYFGFFGGVGVAAPAIGQPDSERWVRKEPFKCPDPSHPGVGQFTPSNLIADAAAATAALCCSTVPPLSSTRILLRFAMGHPEALWESKLECSLGSFYKIKKNIDINICRLIKDTTPKNAFCDFQFFFVGILITLQITKILVVIYFFSLSIFLTFDAIRISP